MQIPARRSKLALLIETFAEHPVAMTVLVLDAVIVARPRRLAALSSLSLVGGANIYLPLAGRSGVAEGDAGVRACASRGEAVATETPSPHPARPLAQPPSPSRGGMISAAGPPPTKSRHHSGAMRSGPSDLTTRRVTRRQVKRAGGPSGISASTVRGSGVAKRSGGRGGLLDVGAGQSEGPAKALFRLCANSGR